MRQQTAARTEPWQRPWTQDARKGPRATPGDAVRDRRQPAVGESAARRTGGSSSWSVSRCSPPSSAASGRSACSWTSSWCRSPGHPGFGQERRRSRSAGMAASALMYLVRAATARGIRRRRRPRSSLAFLVLNAIFVAILNTWLVPPVPDADDSSVVDHGRHPDLRDDRAGVAAEDAGGLARRGVDGSARAAGRLSAGRSGGVAAARGDPRAAELLVRRSWRCCRRGSCTGSAAGCARRRSSAATSSSSCSGTAAWARSGARATSCWPATPRSSWCGRRCSARATRPKPASCCAASSAKRRRRRRSARRTRSRSSTSG